MSTTIMLIRHGETAWNREKIFRGVYDIPLNDNGRAQAGHLAKALAGRRIDKDGVLTIEAHRHRTRERNRADARERLAELVAGAASAPKPRVPTRPSART